MKKYSRRRPLRFSRILLTFLIIAVSFGGAYKFLGNSVDDTSGAESFDYNAEMVAENIPYGDEFLTVEEFIDQAELDDPNIYKSVVGDGDTAGGILQAWLGISDIHEMSSACGSVYALNKIRNGQPYTVFLENGNFKSFEYEIDNDTKLFVSRDEDGFHAEKQDIPYDITLHRVDGTITSNLFNAMSESGENATLAVNLANIFAWEINFIRDLRQGDSYSMLVEKRYREGEFKSYGKLVAATFTNQGNKFDAFMFVDAKGNTDYYDSEGESLRRAFLKAPLSFTRISSGYTSRRLHPITQEWRSHPAIDYAAPTGTPVKVVGRGEVTFVGRDKAAGNYIKVKHSNGYETMYLHLSAFAKGLSKGNSVSQGQVIGFVGATGYATGPHLDFRMKRNGQFVNPLNQLAPRDEPILKAEKAKFKAQVAAYTGFLQQQRNLAEYNRSMFNLN